MIMRKIEKHIRFGLLLCLTLLMMPCFYACGGEPSSSTVLSSIQGEVLVREPGTDDWINGEVGVVLEARHIIKVGPGANATITFFDGSTIELKADTQIEIRELVKGKITSIRLKQDIGETVSKVQRLTDPASRYEIETPSAIAGVRDSAMLVRVALDGTTAVQNLEGQISVTAQGVEVDIPEGSTTTVKPGEPPILELSYDDGSQEGGYSTGGSQNYGFLVRFEPLITPFAVTRVKILCWIVGTPGENSQFTVRIADKALALLWETKLPFTMFTKTPSWLEVDVPSVIVNDEFYVQLYAPTLGQGLGPYIGMDRSGINEHSGLISDWEITPWTLPIPEGQINWMIRVNGDAVTPDSLAYSALDDFSTENGNPNASWSYGWMPTDFSKFNIYTSHNSYQWYGELGSDRTPCIWINTGGVAYGVPTDWLSLHPGPGKEPSVLRWTAPVSGNIYITGQFLSGDGGIMTIAVRHNNQEIWTTKDSGSFALLANVATGDTIDFAVYGEYGSGNTPISVTINY